jgi:hypothetical protein
MYICKALTRIISIRPIFILIIIQCLLFSIESQAEHHIQNYKETIRINGNGSAEVFTTIRMGKYPEETHLYLPLNSPHIKKITAKVEESGKELPVKLKAVDGFKFLCVTLGKTPISGKTLSLSFLNPVYMPWKDIRPGQYGICKYKSLFVNSSTFIIDEYSMEVILPKDYIIHTITESIPKQTKKDPEPPYNTLNEDDMSHLFIKAKELKPCDRCMLKYTFVKKTTSYPLLGGCLIFIVFFLALFRNRLKE